MGLNHYLLPNKDPGAPPPKAPELPPLKNIPP